MSFMSPFPGQLSSYHSDMEGPASLRPILGPFGVHRPVFWHRVGEPQSTENHFCPPKLIASHLAVKMSTVVKCMQVAQLQCEYHNILLTHPLQKDC